MNKIEFNPLTAVVKKQHCSLRWDEWVLS